jgi:hypothetical protein
MNGEPMLAAARHVFGEAVLAPVDGTTDSDKTSWLTPLVCVAFHEAGHAVAHTRLGMPFFEVSVIPDRSEGTAGYVSRPPRWVGRPPRLDGTRCCLRLPFHERFLRPRMTAARPTAGQVVVEKQVLIALAGGWAERLVRSGPGFPGSEHDRSHARSLLDRECLTVPEVGRYLRRLDRRVAAFVRANEREIRAVAYALVDRRLLSSRSVTYIVAWSTPRDVVPSEPWDHVVHVPARGPGERVADGHRGVRDRQLDRNHAGVGRSPGPGMSRRHADLAPAVDSEGRLQ